MSIASRSLALSIALVLGTTTPLLADDNWPSFRGADAGGTASCTVPTTWNIEAGDNIRWKSEIPGMGHSSPVIWNQRIWITTAIRDAGSSDLSSLYGSPGYGAGESVTDEGRHTFRVMCLDVHTGESLWSRDSIVATPRFKRHPKSSHANSTPACDAERVVAFFGSQGLYCYDHEGTLLWARDLGPLNSGAPGYPDKDGFQWGFASSPVLHDGRVIVQCDVENESFLAVLDARDGKDIWRVARDENSTWCTPTILHRGAGGREQIVVNGYKHIGGYDLRNGKRRLDTHRRRRRPGSNPGRLHDLIYITSAHGRMRPIYAIRTSATGALSIDPNECEYMAWSYPRRGVYMQTPIAVGGLLYCCSDGGILSCYDARTGELNYRERLGEGTAGLSASAVAAGGHLYFTSESGEVRIVNAGPTFELVATNDMGETCMATPAIGKDTMYVRTRHHLIAIGE